jgi:hypothetical protein
MMTMLVLFVVPMTVTIAALVVMSRRRDRAEQAKRRDAEARLDLWQRQVEDLRLKHGKEFIAFCESCLADADRRGVTIWQVYAERAYDHYVAMMAERDMYKSFIESKGYTVVVGPSDRPGMETRTIVGSPYR